MKRVGLIHPMKMRQTHNGKTLHVQTGSHLIRLEYLKHFAVDPNLSSIEKLCFIDVDAMKDGHKKMTCKNIRTVLFS